MDENKKQIQTRLDNEYKLIPMGDISAEARAIAVRWVEGFEPIGGIELRQKHKLASDIMNYAAHQSTILRKEMEEKDKALRLAIEQLQKCALTIEMIKGEDIDLQGEFRIEDIDFVLNKLIAECNKSSSEREKEVDNG